MGREQDIPNRGDYFVKDVAAPNASIRIGQEYARIMLRDALREDLSTQESTQVMQRSGRWITGPFPARST